MGNYGTNLNNTGPLVRQHVVSTGSASYTYVKSHTFGADSDDRRYDNAPYQLQDIVTNFQLDITPTSGAGPTRQNSLLALASSVSGDSVASAASKLNKEEG